MNIDSIKNYPTGSLVKHKRKNTNALINDHKSADLCESKNVNRGYYSGSFTGINVAAAASSSAKKAETLFDKILTLCDNHTVIAQNLVALVLAAGLRPIAIMSLPGKKDKEDKKYASGHSIASGLIGFGFSSIVMLPLGKAASKFKGPVTEAATVLKALKDQEAGKALKPKLLEKINKVKEKYKVDDLRKLEDIEVFKKLKKTFDVNSLPELEHSGAYKNVVKILDMAPDVFLFGVLKAMLTIALIPPILKYGFGVEKKKKVPAAEQQAVATAQQQNNTPAQTQTIQKPDMSKFAGGLK